MTTATACPPLERLLRDAHALIREYERGGNVTIALYDLQEAVDAVELRR